MYEIHLTETIAAPRERVFEAISDHEVFISGPEIDSCRLVKPGDAERNGLGAIREVRSNGYLLTEDITRFERPTGYDYRVRELLTEKSGRRQPFDHERGWLELTEVEGGTRIDWRTRFRFTIPLIGWLLERIQGPKLAANLEGMLARCKQRLESEVAAAGG